MLRFNLSAETQARLDEERREALRLHGLTNPWLAAALLKLAREARATTTLRPDDLTYDASLVWGVVPELARRLGTVKLEAAEIDWESRALSDYELRQRVGHCIANAFGRDTFAWRMLTRIPAHGNPAAIAADRLLAGVPGDKDDPISRSLTEIASVRGVPYAGTWAPEAFCLA